MNAASEDGKGGKVAVGADDQHDYEYLAENEKTFHVDISLLLCVRSNYTRCPRPWPFLPTARTAVSL